MANTVVLKRSAVPNKTPTTSDLALGELALNTNDGNLFFKKDVSGTQSILSVATLTGAQTFTNKTLDSAVLTGTLTAGGGTGTSGQLLRSTGTGVEWATVSGTGTVTSITAGTGLTGGTITGSGTIAIDSTVVTLTDTQTLTNKTISASNNTISGLTNSNLSGSAGISNANLANSSVTIGSTAISLGATATTIAGLSSVTSTSFVGSLTGNADTATKLQTSRTINGVSFDGSANITINAVDSTARIASSEKGAPNGVATLDSSGLVPSTQLPSYVDDVLEYSNLASFPATGETGKIYVALDTNKTYRWSGSAYIFITSGAVDSVAGKTGVVTLDKNDVGLNNVDNTADSAKSVSSAATLTTARTINGVSFDGSANITVTANTTNALTIGTGLSGTSFNGSGAVTIALASDYGDTQNPYASKTANTFLAAPNGTAGAPTFRAIVAADIPTLNQNTTGTAENVTGTVAVANGGTGQTSYTNGQLLIGNSTGNTLTKATLTAGAGITITNGAGSITIESTASGGGSTPWIFKTANYTASASDRIIATTTSGSFTITLPASPSAGDEVIIADGDNWQTNNLIINRNGTTIKGLAENLTMDLAGVKAEFVYSGSTWLVFAFASGADDTLAISLAIGDDF
jgi:hypothetical protein